MIRFTCPHCGSDLGFPESTAGDNEFCPGCEKGIVVPRFGGGVADSQPGQDRTAQLATAENQAYRQPVVATSGEGLTEEDRATVERVFGEPCPKPAKVAPAPRGELTGAKRDWLKMMHTERLPGPHRTHRRSKSKNEVGPTAKQEGYARTIGLILTGEETREEVSDLLASFERVKHYLFGLWIFLVGESATRKRVQVEYVRTFAVAIVNQDPGVCQEICDLVGPDGHSEEFLATEIELRAAIGREFMKKFEVYAGRPFPVWPDRRRRGGGLL